jgi:preprotein translocase subunit SecE
MFLIDILRDNSGLAGLIATFLVILGFRIYFGTKKGIVAKKFLLEAREELKKVTWPDRDEVTSFTGVVVVTVIVFSMFLWFVDTGLMSIIKLMMN